MQREGQVGPGEPRGRIEFQHALEVPDGVRDSFGAHVPDTQVIVGLDERGMNLHRTLQPQDPLSLLILRK